MDLDRWPVRESHVNKYIFHMDRMFTTANYTCTVTWPALPNRIHVDKPKFFVTGKTAIRHKFIRITVIDDCTYQYNKADWAIYPNLTYPFTHTCVSADPVPRTITTTNYLTVQEVRTVISIGRIRSFLRPGCRNGVWERVRVSN